MTESAAIVLHLAELKPEAGLAPAPDDHSRRAFLNRLIWFVSVLYPTFSYRDYPERWAPDAAEQLAERVDAFRDAFSARAAAALGDDVDMQTAVFARIDLYTQLATLFQQWYASQATAAIEQAMARIQLPTREIQAGFEGNTAQMLDALAKQPMMFLAALVALYIVLGMLYESYMHPLTILSTLPSAGIGALLALMMTSGEFNLIAMIGVFLLIGIVKKNAIMMVDYALQMERERGMGSREAIYEACLVRFRPIMMTTLSAIFGAIPLILASGPGVEMRQPLGVTIVGGLVLSQILTLYTTPVVYLYLDRWRHRFMRRKNQTTLNI